MAFKEAKQTSSGYDTITWNKEKKAGAVLEGTYVDKQINVQGKPGSNIFVIENEEGKWAVWSCKMLEDYFSSIETGSVVRITFIGKEKTKGGRDLNKYLVEVDDGEAEDKKKA